MYSIYCMFAIRWFLHDTDNLEERLLLHAGPYFNRATARAELYMLGAPDDVGVTYFG